MKIAIKYGFVLLLIVLVSIPSLAQTPTVVTKAVPVGEYRGNNGHTGAFPDSMGQPLSLLWRHTTASFQGNSASPVFADGSVYFAAGPTFYALNPLDGTVIWQFKAPDNSKAAFDTTPALEGGFIYITDSNSELIKLDAQTGKPIWTQKFSGALRSAPVVSGGAVYFGSGNNHCYAVSADTGQTLWDQATQGAITTSPTITGGLVVFASSDSSLYSFSTTTGRIAWTKPLPADPSLYPPVFDGNNLYVSAGDIVYVLDASNGNKQLQIQLPTNSAAPPTVGSDAIYLVTQTHILYALNGGGHKRWQATLSASLTAPPILAGNVLLAATHNGVLTGYDIATGAVTWQYVMQSAGNDMQPEYTSTEVAAAPVFAGRSLYVVSDDGTLSAFRSDAVDGIAPQFRMLVPAEDSTTPGAHTAVGAVVADPGSGLDPKSISLQVDGTADTAVVYYPEQAAIVSSKTTLPDGPHVLSVSLSDWHGNKVTRTWNFTIGVPAPRTPVPGQLGMPPGMPPRMPGMPSQSGPMQPPPPPPISAF